MFAQDTHKLDVGLVGKIAMRADLSANGLPGFAGNRKIRVFDQNDEVRIADRHFNTNDLGAIESA